MAQRIGWLHDELLLAADLVSRNNWSAVRANNPAAEELSQLLRQGTLHPGKVLPDDFRSPWSIQRKTFDLATSDPSYQGKATRGALRDADVLAAFRRDASGMQAAAAEVRRLLLENVALPQDWSIDVDNLSFEEGGVVEYLGRRRERSSKLREAKISDALKTKGSLECEICQFDFSAFYGSRGDRYIEVHHRTPLHASGSTRSSLKELVLLCANCHRMCHRGNWITPDELRAMIREARGA
ncbi:HNH endonuclease [Microbacterium foliorum]